MPSGFLFRIRIPAELRSGPCYPHPRGVAMAVMTYCILKYKYHLVYIHTLSPAHFMSRSSLSSSRKCDSSLSFLSVPTRRPLTASLPCPPTLLLQEVRFRRELSLLAVSIHGFHLALTDSSSRIRPRSPCYAHSPLRKCGAILQYPLRIRIPAEPRSGPCYPHLAVWLWL